ncbi:SCO3374 family protein [Streptomyces sp. NPDC003753]|uniref:SCO3374 family protein n=1 Tax=unclassified Streptomyces TaxID=2593676 RepID=UPI001908DF68|nr:SCO3374 family protein [Streptomyces sp. Y2F8-2]
MVHTVLPAPPPRRPLDPGTSATVRQWYEHELGWATAPGEPVRLVTGVRFDVLEVPAEAGFAALRHLGPASPVALCAGRMRLLVAAGSAEELPGLLDWLEWGALALDLTVTGAGGRTEAPLPPGWPPASVPDPAGTPDSRPLPLDRAVSQGAAVWLRPPEPGCEVEQVLPTLSAVGGGGGAPDLVRLVDTVATQCHRVRLRRACAQPIAFS